MSFNIADIRLVGGEIEVTMFALKQRINILAGSNTPDTARPYQSVIDKIAEATREHTHDEPTFSQQQVEQMMNELVGMDKTSLLMQPPIINAEWSKSHDDWRKAYSQSELQAEQRQSIPSIIKKYGGNL